MKKIYLILILAFSFTQTSFAQVANVNLSTRVGQVRSFEGSAFSSSSCQETGNEEYTAYVYARVGSSTYDSGCLTCDNNGNCTYGQGTTIRNYVSTTAQSFITYLRAWENDAGDRCTKDSGDNDCVVNPSNEHSTSFRVNAPKSNSAGTWYSTDTYGGSHHKWHVDYAWQYTTNGMSGSALEVDCLVGRITIPKGSGIEAYPMRLYKDNTYEFTLYGDVIGGYNSYLTIYGPDGSSFVAGAAENYDTPAKVSFKATTDGVYFVEATYNNRDPQILENSYLRYQMINPPTPVLSASQTSACKGAEIQFSVSNIAGGIDYEIQYMPPNLNYFIPFGLSNVTSFNWNTTGLAIGDYIFRVVMGGGCNKFSNNVQIKLVNAPIIYLYGSGEICRGESQRLWTNYSGGSNCFFQWQVSTNGSEGPWTIIPGATSYEYFASPLVTSWYRAQRICDAVGCDDPISNVEEVTIIPSPWITCPSNIEVYNPKGVCGVNIFYSNRLLYDECSTVELTAGLASGERFPIGTTTNSYKATYSGNSATCSFTVTVIDIEKPTIVCPANMTVSVNTQNCEALVNYDVTATDNCQSTITVNQLSGHPSGYAFPMGTTNNSFEVVDGVGLTASCSFSITVVDDVLPTANCKDLTIELDVDGLASISVADVDNGSFDCNYPVFNLSKTSFDCSNLGENTVTLTIKDAANNSNSCPAKVTIVDRQVPTVVCNDITVQLDANQTASVAVADIDGGSADNCNLTSSITAGPTTFDCADLGQTYTLTLEVKDLANNTATCNALVTIADDAIYCNRTPVAVCQNLTVSTDANCVNTSTAANFDGGSTDLNGDLLTFSVIPAGPYSVGVTNVVLTVVDPDGASSTCSATITVTDDTPPTALCKNATVNLDSDGDGSITIADVDNGSYDACGLDGVSPLSLDVTSFTCANVGVNTVTLTVLDANKNSNTCTATVNVLAPKAIISGGGPICSGGQMILSASVLGGAPANSFQWQTASSPGGPWSDISGATSDTHDTGPLSTVTYFRVEFIPTGTGCNNTYSDVFTANVVPDAIVTNQNSNRTVCRGGSVSLSGPYIRDGIGPFTYQWQQASTSSGPWYDIPNANNLSYSTNPLFATTFFRTRVSSQISGCNDVFSDAVQVTVIPDPIITLSGGGTFCGYANTTLVASIEGGISGFYFCYWEVASGPFGPWTTFAFGPNLNTQNISRTGTAYYRVRMVNSSTGCDATSNTVSIVTRNPPQVFISLGGLICPDGQYSFTNINSEKPGTYTLQWQRSTTSSTGPWSDIPGATGETLLTPATSVTSWYRVIITSSTDVGCYNWSSSERVLVVPDPQISISGVNTICTGEEGVLSATLSGSFGTFTYQWQTATSETGPWTTIEGATSSSYSFNGTQSNTGLNYFRVMAYDENGYGCNTDYSAPKSVNVLAAPTVQLYSDYPNVCLGDNRVRLYASVSPNDDPGPFTYKWEKASSQTGPWSPLPGETVEYRGSISELGDTYFRAIITGTLGCSSSISNIVKVTVSELPEVTLSGGGTFCPGDELTLTTTLSGGAPGRYYYVWYLSNSPNGPWYMSSHGIDLTSLSWNAYYTYYRVQIYHLFTGGCYATSNVQEVIVNYNPPNALCRDVEVVLNSEGVGSISVEDVDAGSNDDCGLATYDPLSLNISSFSCADIDKENTVILTVTNKIGTRSTCSAKVTVLDVTPPVASCKDITVDLDESGNATITAESLNNTSSDICGGLSYEADISSFTCAELGENTVILTVKDGSKNSSTCSAKVTVRDITPPVTVCTDITVDLDESGNASITQDAVNNASYDACGGSLDITTNMTSFDCSHLGENTVELTVTDARGNSASCEATVTVRDVTPPVALCKEITIDLDANGQVTIDEDALNDGSYDVCGGDLSFSMDETTFNCNRVGRDYYQMTVTDARGNSATCGAIITIRDMIPPTITCADPQSQTADANQCGAIVTVVGPTTDDNCEVQSVVNSFNNTADASGYYPVGTTTVTWTVTDIHGNINTCTQDITVTDDEDPIIICADPQSQTADQGQCGTIVTVVGPTAEDNCEMKSVVNDFNNTADASGFYPVGTTTITWTVTDIHDNTSTCTQDITVTDDEAPTITCADPQSQTADANQCGAIVTVVGPTTGDNCGVQSVVNDYNGTADASDTYPVGTTTVTWTVTDIHGHTNTCTQDITVTDDEAPSITCPAQTQTADQGLCSAHVTVVAPVTGDNCGVESLVNDYNDTADASDTYPVGTTTVTWTVTDIHGNTNTRTQDITVTDDEAPVFTLCPTGFTITLSNEVCETVATYDFPEGMDNCGVESLLQTKGQKSGSTFQMGPNEQEFTLTDIHGNTSKCTFTILVDGDQTDSDGDGVSNSCDICPGADDLLDSDSDGLPDCLDPCPMDPNNSDSDGDGIGDGCDNCPSIFNTSQADSDNDGVGNACDICQGSDDTIDSDGDGVPDGCDICAGGNDLVDSDGDGIPDDCDNCPDNRNANQTDSDGDGVGDSCDNCKNAVNPDQTDTDGDGKGDVCDKTPGTLFGAGNIQTVTSKLTPLDFTLYPNPTRKEINVGLKDFTGQAVQLTIYNHLGQTVRIMEIDEVQIPTQRIEVDQLGYGTYLMQLRTKDQVLVKKFVILE